MPSTFPASWNPEPYMQQVSQTLEAADGPLTADQTARRTKIRYSYASRALKMLVEAGHVTVQPQGNKRWHTIVTPYRVPDRQAQYMAWVAERIAEMKAAEQ